MFEYWFCIISRKPSVSLSLPPLDGTSAGGRPQVEPVMESNGPVNVELFVLFQSTWNFHTRTRSVYTAVSLCTRPVK
jgi:hypothetical protein